MPKTVEIYRGIEIHASALSLYDPERAKGTAHLYQARVNECHVVGGLSELKKEIDRKLTGGAASGTTGR